MAVERKRRIIWLFDRPADSNPFIGISVETLRAAGYDVFMIDGAETHQADADAAHPYSRSHWARNFNAVKNFINTNPIIRFFDRRDNLAAANKKLRKLKSEKESVSPFDWQVNRQRIQVWQDAAMSGIYTFLWKGLRRAALFRRDSIDKLSPYIKGFFTLIPRNADVIIVSRATVLAAAWLVARIKGWRLIYFPFELYGDQAATASPLISASERWVLKRGVDVLVTQNEKRAEIYAERGHSGPVQIVHNYKPFRPVSSGGGLREALGIPKEKKIVLYEGMLIPGRWLDRLAQASLYLPDDVVMVFLGPVKRWWEDNHVAFTREPISRGKLKIAPAVSHQDLLDFIADADVGVIIYDDSKLNNYFCEPGKLSDYAFAEIPVVAPDFPTVGPVVRSFGMGACFREYSPESIAATISEVLARRRDEWRPALRAAAAFLSWESQTPALVAAVSGEENAAISPGEVAIAVPRSQQQIDSRERVDILILIEHADRELDVACLINAYIAALAPRLKVKVANFYTEAQSLIANCAPRVVVTPFLYAIEDKIMRDYVSAWSNAVFFNLAWEQILYGSQQTLKRPRDSFTRDRVQHLAWSEWFRDYLVSHGVSQERVHWLGHPLYDLYDPALRDYFPGRKEIADKFGLDPDKRWVFFPENYRWAFLSDRKLTQMSEQGVDIADLEAQRVYCRQALSAGAQWLSALARMDGFEAILRPRPAVNTLQMKAFIEEHAGSLPANFHLLKQLSVREWIFASDLTVSSISTSLIEAAVAGKPILRASPCEVPGTLWYDWCEHVPVVKTEAEFIKAASGAPDMSGSIAVRNWARQSFKVGEKPARAIAELLIRLVNQAPRSYGAVPPPIPIRPFWLDHAASIAPLRMRHKLRARYEPGYFFNYETHEKDLFGDFEVRRRTESWKRLLKRREGRIAA